MPNGDRIENTYQSVPGGGDVRTQVRIIQKKYIPANDPTHPLIETWEYNHDFGSGGGCGCGNSSFATKYVDAIGNSTPTPFRVTWMRYDANGNMTRRVRDVGSLMADENGVPGPGDIVDEYTYYPDIDPENPGQPHPSRGLLHTHTHPSNGTHQRVDEYIYDNGYLVEMRVDVGGSNPLNLTTITTYDVMGNVRTVSDPKGYTRTYLYNQLGWLIRETGPVNVPNTAITQRDLYYDANGNVTREDVANNTPDGPVAANPAITTFRKYDELNMLLGEAREADAVDVPALGVPQPWTYDAVRNDARFSTTEYIYNRNKQLEYIVPPETVLGGQPSGAVRRTYDERGLLFTETRGVFPPPAPGQISPADPPTAVTTRFDYTANGKMSARIEGWTMSAGGRTTLYEYDNYDRMFRTTDPMGNVTEYEYDLVGKATQVSVYGELDDSDPGSTNNVLLSRTQMEYDPLDRVARRLVWWSGPFAPVYMAWRYYYNPDSSIDQVWLPPTPDLIPGGAFPAINKIFYTYDRASRLKSVADSDGNVVSYTYDQNSNVIQVNSHERHDTQTPVFAQIFDVATAYNGLNQPVNSTDGVGNVSTSVFDSRGHLIRATDADNSQTLMEYDGLSREISMEKWGYETIEGELTWKRYTRTQKHWDANSRLVGQTDDNGNRTSYAYDDLGRRIITRMADGTLQMIGTTTEGWTAWTNPAVPPNLTGFVTGFDRFSNPITIRDANGTTIVSQVDQNNRVTARTISFAAMSDVIGTTWEEYKYDGLSRVISARDNDSLVTRTYDSLSRVISETTYWDPPATPDPASGKTVTYFYDPAGNLITMTYPGGRTVHREYDKIRRLKAIRSNIGGTGLPDELIANYDYLGPSRVASMTRGNGTQTFYGYDGHSVQGNPAGDYGFRQIVSVTHQTAAATVFDQWDYRWDRAQNKTRRIKLVGGAASLKDHRYTYDGAHRLIKSEVKHPNDPELETSWIRQTEYLLDGVHNRTTVDFKPNGLQQSGAQGGMYTMTATGPLLDRPVNQYTNTPLDRITYDNNGNVNSIAPQASGLLIIQLFGGQHGASPALVAAAQAAAASGGSWLDLALGSGLNEKDLQLLGELIEGIWTPTARLAALRYDYRNQMVEYDDQNTTSLNRYSYDCFGRRIRKIVDVNGTAGMHKEVRYVHGGQSGWQVLEEFHPTMGTLATNVWGLYIDELVQRRFDADGSANTQYSENDYYFHSDDLFSVTAVTDLNGAVVERYEYGDYGKPSVLDANGALKSQNQSTIGSRYLFTGREWEPETGIYYYRTRYMDPGWGRFLSRDAIGTWGDSSNQGNGVCYISSSPHGGIDPLGLKDYRIGIDDPNVPRDAGSGPWKSKNDFWTKSKLFYLRKELLENILPIISVRFPEAAEHYAHYLRNTGDDLEIDVNKLLHEDANARANWYNELDEAVRFAESLPDGDYFITSGSPGQGETIPNQNWFRAIGNHAGWGKGRVTACKDTFTLKFVYKVKDYYNWNLGQGISFAGQWIQDDWSASFHLYGLAKEFTVHGHVVHTITWKRGQFQLQAQQLPPQGRFGGR